MSHQAARSKPAQPISAANQWRYGQAVMNVLYDVWPKKYHEITNTDYDCFYTNQIVQSTLDKLEKEWHEKTR